ncbi:MULTISPECIES: metallophosphoesterase [unclassified Oceanispirochaeta]|uniref:metallophosphoesterase family protein n=1 Tax=unclassified Oceanispirochaeta TaxID=2635722 RepID=UPI000E096771|nr:MULTISPECIES: metallophosphoesterase [unclassified Oceanispirochaeta]MBF9016837.1 metallophosphoesterase [Oceanispirochaeta sp. M2]NPD73200.1 metallophosphoesterase [Oceanispirochaeta sp. M1]RDG31068.1 metallophosphoesterase [Oceanispirochaeta sp. M1]
MKILIVADHKDPLVYSPNIKKRFGDVELVLGAGDLNMDYYGFIVSSLNKPLYFVFGNHNLKHFNAFKKRESPLQYQPDGAAMDSLYGHSFGATYIGDKVVRIKSKNLLIAGLGGSRRYNKDPSQYTEFQMYMKIYKMIPRLMWNKMRHGRYLDILLTHASPRGIHDKDDPCHKGFKSFLWFMEKFSPPYLLHGHIHLYSLNEKRVTQYKNTTVINTYDHYVLDFEVNDE